MVHLLWKTAWRFLKKLNTELPYDQQFHSYVHTQRNWQWELKHMQVQAQSEQHSLQ